MPFLHITDNIASVRIKSEAGGSLAEAIWLSGNLEPVSLCGGLALCGNCRCRFLQNAPEPVEAEREYFSWPQISAGWRLACRHYIPDEPNIFLELPAQSFRLEAKKPAAKKTLFSAPAIMGIDLGTTSIQWRCISSDENRETGGSILNPQAAAGADIISRIKYALAWPDKLGGLVLTAISGFIEQAEAAGLKVQKMCIAANSALTEILLNKDLSGLAHAPYSLAFSGNKWINLRLPASDRYIETYFPPLAAPFVGGDITAGLATLLHKPQPFLLIDLGTNAELALLKENNLTIVSAPLGPALEGIGPRNGQPAGPGVITGFTLAPAGLSPLYYRNQAVEKPAGISATGYLALISILLKLGLINRDSQFITDSPLPLAQKISRMIIDNELILSGQLKLTLHDLELLIKVRGTFRVALDRLMETAAVVPGEIRKVYIAGAISEHVNPEDLITLGFFPAAFLTKLYMAGNTSLKGACMLAQNDALAQRLAALCGKSNCLQLADEKEFMDQYLNAMRWGQ